MTIESFEGNYEFLSNFHKCLVPFSIRRVRFFTVEHAYQALKAVDISEFHRIASAVTPNDAKKLGRHVDLNEAYWEKVKLGIMYQLLEMKFWSNPTLASKLSNTAGQRLVEGNHWHDNFWGDCHCGGPDCEEKGKNMLGKLLMQVRKEF